MSETPGDLHGSATRAIAEGLVHGLKAAAPHLQEQADLHRVDTLTAVTDALRPLVHELVGRHLEELPAAHPLHALVGQARVMHGADGPGTPSSGGPLPHPGGVIDDIVDVFLTILGVVGAAFGVLPALGQIILREYVQGLNVRFANQVLSPQDLADMVERGILPLDDAAGEAEQSGVNKTRFGLLVQDTGEPPGIMQALELLRRGEVSLGWFQRVVAYSRVRTEYTPELVKLAWATMSPADAIELALKQVLPEEQARALFAAGGGLPAGGAPAIGGEGGGGRLPPPPEVDQYKVLLDAAGNPIGPEAAANLWAHKLIGEARLDEVIAHSRINPRFSDLVKLTHRKWLSAFQIETMLKQGTVSPDKATEWMLEDGYPEDQVAAFVSALHGSAVVKAKTDSETMVVERYEARMITEEHAVAELRALGYTETAAQIVLQAAEARRVNAQTTAAVGKLRASYLSGRLTPAKVRGELARLKLPADAVDAMLTAWDVERETTTRELTSAQVGKLVKDGFQPPEWALARWEAMGYSHDDALALLAIEAGLGPPAPPPPTRPPRRTKA